MRKITEALRLHHECNRSHREIASAIGASPITVSQYLRRAREAGIGNLFKQRQALYGEGLR